MREPEPDVRSTRGPQAFRPAVHSGVRWPGHSVPPAATRRAGSAVHLSQGEALLTARRWVAACLTAVGLLVCTSAAKADATLDLENLSGTQLEQMLQNGQV